MIKLISLLPENIKKILLQSFDPTSAGPRPEATEGQPPDSNFYASEINKMRKMEETSDVNQSPNPYFTGVVDAYNSSKAIKHGPEQAGKSHKNFGFGNHFGRWRYIPRHNRVDWTDTPSPENLDSVDNYLHKQNLHPKSHVSYIGNITYRINELKV